MKLVYTFDDGDTIDVSDFSTFNEDYTEENFIKRYGEIGKRFYREDGKKIFKQFISDPLGFDLDD